MKINKGFSLILPRLGHALSRSTETCCRLTEQSAPPNSVRDGDANPAKGPDCLTRLTAWLKRTLNIADLSALHAYSRVYR